MIYTIDASVFVSAAFSKEIHHQESLIFLGAVRKQGKDVFCPTLVLAECASAIAGQTDQPVLAERMVALIKNFPKLFLIPLDLFLSESVVRVAVDYRLRGADAVYTAVAQKFNAVLVTWDKEMAQRSSSSVKTMMPSDKPLFQFAPVEEPSISRKSGFFNCEIDMPPFDDPIEEMKEYE